MAAVRVLGSGWLSSGVETPDSRRNHGSGLPSRDGHGPECREFAHKSAECHDTQQRSALEQNPARHAHTADRERFVIGASGVLLLDFPSGKVVRQFVHSGP